jgi:hypothetical protein
MVDNKDVVLTHLDDLEDPRQLFHVVMFYADATEKNPWECMAYVFNPLHHTVIIWEGHKIIGYISTELLEDNQLFIYHAFCKYGVVDKPKLLDDMIKLIGKKLNYNFPVVTMHSDRPSRAWEKWGFKQSKMIIYEREVE